MIEILIHQPNFVPLNQIGFFVLVLFIYSSSMIERCNFRIHDFNLIIGLESLLICKCFHHYYKKYILPQTQMRFNLGYTDEVTKGRMKTCHFTPLVLKKPRGKVLYTWVWSPTTVFFFFRIGCRSPYFISVIIKTEVIDKYYHLGL